MGLVYRRAPDDLREVKDGATEGKRAALLGGRLSVTLVPLYTSIMEDRPKTGYCWCGCGERPRGSDSRFVPGHDRIAEGKIGWAVRENWMQDLSPALKWYGENRGLLRGDEPRF